jgi:hypothetical protein
VIWYISWNSVVGFVFLLSDFISWAASWNEWSV